jgi:hypothetical protein
MQRIFSVFGSHNIGHSAGTDVLVHLDKTMVSGLFRVLFQLSK